MMFRTTILAITLLAVSLPVLAGEAFQVVIDQFRFTPAEVRIKPGGVVEWVNAEKRTSHSIVFEGEPESDRLFPGESFRKTFPTPGTYRYICGPHPEMAGIVEVVP